MNRWHLITIPMLLFAINCWLHPVYQQEDTNSSGEEQGLLALIAGSNSNSSTNRGFKYIFVTAATPTGGGVNGLSGADSLCQTDSRNPGTGTFKALLGIFNLRHWCRSDMGSCPGGSSLNWVISPSTEYRRLDGITTVATSTPDSHFSFPLDNTYSTDTDDAWTGLANDMTSNAGSSECGNWVSTGCCGNHITLTNTSGINEGNLNCSLPARLICVEQ